MVDGGRGDPGGRLRWQSKFEPIDQELKFGFGMGVAGEQDLAPIGGRQMDVDHLDSGELFERTTCGQPGRQGVKPARQRDLHAVGQEGDEDVGLNPRLVLMEHRADCQIALEVAERLFDGDQLDVVLPELSGVVVSEISPKFSLKNSARA
jgi:hypothetical protein